jgi:predicted amidohydrolase YtcJ
VKAHKDDDIIRGIGWVKTNYTDSTMPTRHDIDGICSDKPVVLESFCQHNLWVNTRALELAALDENCPDPVAGIIYREANGYPAGVFSEPEAMDLIKQRIQGYDFTPEKYMESFKIYQRQDANRYGITMVQDCMYSDNAREAYKTLARNEDLTVRVRGVYMVSPADHKNEMVKYAARKGADNVGEDFSIDTIKIFTEGSDFPFLEPYTMESARQLHWENIMGSLEVGKLANMIITDKDLFKTPLNEIKDIKTEVVIFDGKIIRGSL